MPTDRTISPADQGLLARTLELARSGSPASRQVLSDALEGILACGYRSWYVDMVLKYIDVTDRDVLEIGCGSCWHAPLYLALGARSFTGIEPTLDLTTRRIEKLESKFGTAQEREQPSPEMPLELGAFIGCFDNVQLMQGELGDLSGSMGPFSAAILLTVTEHLADPATAMSDLAALLAPGAQVFLTHGNYYGWRGHHLDPQQVDGIDLTDERTAGHLDWAHIRNIAAIRDIWSGLNGIRMHELVEIIQRDFDVTHREPVPSRENEGGGRLSENIRQQYPHLYEDEFTTDILRITAVRRGSETAEDASESDHTVPVRSGEPDTVDGHCHIVRVSAALASDTWQLMEDGRPLSPRDALHEAIRERGQGAWSLNGVALFYSSSDGSDPRTNGRSYELRRAPPPNGGRRDSVAT